LPEEIQKQKKWEPVLRAQRVQRILVKDKFKDGKWEKCKERRKLV
jgi:hypothetical protein